MEPSVFRTYLLYCTVMLAYMLLHNYIYIVKFCFLTYMLTRKLLYNDVHIDIITIQGMLNILYILL